LTDYPNIDALLDVLPEQIVSATPGGLELIAERACAARQEIERIEHNRLVEIVNQINDEFYWIEESYP
jgi:hypothetical protein